MVDVAMSEQDKTDEAEALKLMNDIREAAVIAVAGVIAPEIQAYPGLTSRVNPMKLAADVVTPFLVHAGILRYAVGSGEAIDAVKAIVMVGVDHATSILRLMQEADRIRAGEDVG